MLLVNPLMSEPCAPGDQNNYGTVNDVNGMFIRVHPPKKLVDMLIHI